jgi:hypothetical protein
MSDPRDTLNNVTQKLLAIGGSKHLQYIEIPNDKHEWLVPVIEPVQWHINSDSIREPSGKIDQYRVEKLHSYKHATRKVLLHSNMHNVEALELLRDWLVTRFITGDIDGNGD